MNFDEILANHGKESSLIINMNLSNLNNCLFGRNKWKFAYDYNSETNASVSGKHYEVIIGNRALSDNCDDFEYNKAAYVLIVKDIYHEQRHVWQYTKAWNDESNLNSVKSYRQTTNMIRRKFVGDYFPSSYYNNYSNDPSEMDAEKYGIKMALIYFKSDPIVSEQDAKNILYQLMMSDDCVHKEMLDSYKDRLNSIYDVLDVFEERMDTATIIKYPITDRIVSRFEEDVSDKDLSLTYAFQYSEDFEEYRKVFNKCNTGIEQDKVMEQVILFADRNNIIKAPLRLRDELIECRRQMKLGTPGTGPHAISPKRINYSIQSIELTDEDVATIPMDDDIKL